MFDVLAKNAFSIVFVVVFLELIFAVYMDIKFAKFPNKVFLSYLALNLIFVFFLRGLEGYMVSAITLFVAFLILAPIYFVRMLGGGDIKLLFAVAPLLLIEEYLAFVFLSLVWSSLFGLFRAGLGGNLRSLLSNTFLVARRLTYAEEKMPFTVGILLGWCSYKSFLSLGYWF